MFGQKLKWFKNFKKDNRNYYFFKLLSIQKLVLHRSYK